MNLQSTPITAISKTDVYELVSELLGTNDELSESEIKARMSKVETIYNGDHTLKIWKDESGLTKIAIQGTGEEATLITLAA